MPEQLLLTAKAHNNHYLFSDYYLDNRVGERREWRETDVRAGFEALAELWQQRKSALIHANEAQTEADWIRPVLRMLGHHFTVQVSIQAQGGSKTPDYIFCPDEVTRATIQAHAGPASEADLAGALAVGDAKAWDRPLDRTLTTRWGENRCTSIPACKSISTSAIPGWIGAFSPMGGCGGSITKIHPRSWMCSTRWICRRCWRRRLAIDASGSFQVLLAVLPARGLSPRQRMHPAILPGSTWC